MNSETSVQKNGFPVTNLVTGLIGGIVGGVIGFFAFKYLVSQGLYSLIVPGALVGLGFGFASRVRHVAFGVISAVMGLAACLVCEWKVLNPDSSFSEFLGGFKNEGVMTWVFLVLGVAAAYYFGVGRTPHARPEVTSGGIR